VVLKGGSQVSRRKLGLDLALATRICLKAWFGITYINIGEELERQVSEIISKQQHVYLSNSFVPPQDVIEFVIGPES
jgi:hypothetical protein